jgi:hypothetical protein
MIGIAVRRTISQDVAPMAMSRSGGGRPTVSVRVSHVASGLDRLCGSPVPRQQLVESIDRVSIDHALEHVAQVGVGFDVVHLGSLCRRPNYAEQFWEYPVIPAHLRAVNLPSSRCHSA